MEALYNSTNSTIQETHRLFSSLEHNNNEDSALELEERIRRNIVDVSTNCVRMGIQVMKIPLLHREQAKMKYDQLRYDCKHLESALQAAQMRRHRRAQAASDREQLLQTRFASNPEATAVNLDFGVEQNNAMYRAHRGVDEMLHTGASTLESLRGQRTTLKGAHKRIMDMANALGLSTHIMRLIERRASQDKLILMGGIALTLTIIGIVLIFWR